MPVINILSPHVADLIAAGEVVERPASVVKELTENAIDAGAKNITVELQRGGLTFIRVTDDGCGMLPEDAGVCFLRHATSKLRDEQGLEAIGTLGFRGEALAAISSVSRIELVTRQKDAPEGVEMLVEAGDIQYMRPVGCPRGTVMTVRDLFYNTPARLKFMKSDRAELSQCVAVAVRCALAHPEVSIRCLKDGREEFFTPGDGKLLSASYAVLGREVSAGMLACAGEQEGISVTGFVSSPRNGRGNRSGQFFFVNGRCIRSLTMQTALENAYKNSLMVGKYPACTLHVNLSCAAVDVNVHPTKAEVKFSDDKKVYDAVYYSVLSALNAEETAKSVELSTSTRRVTEAPRAPAPPMAEPASEPVREKSYRVISAEEYGRRFMGGGIAPAAQYSPAPRRPAPEVRENEPPKSSVRLSDILPREKEAPAPRQAEIPLPVPEPVPAPAPQPEPRPEDSPWRLIGEALNTYILVERDGELIFIDKHAAHERILFDRLKAAGLSAMSQTLLEPIVFRAGVEVRAALEEHGERFAELGFEVDSFGETELIIRAIPDSIDAAEAVSTLEELAADISAGGNDATLHTMACKAAIKAGRRSEPGELLTLAKQVMSGKVKYCPHGRPVSFALSKKELDKQIKRIV
ncbi:MAG: DNA mismatch repair endonuclease MutL [Candidatus Heteroscillospira sp.]|jgi:DNA mismatch repair protein MutL